MPSNQNNKGFSTLIIVLIIILILGVITSIAVYTNYRQPQNSEAKKEVTNQINLPNTSPELTYLDNNKTIKITNPKNNYSITFSNEYLLDTTWREKQVKYSTESRGLKLHETKRIVDFKVEGENFTLKYLPDQIFYQVHFGEEDTEIRPDQKGYFEIQSFSGKFDPKIFWKDSIDLKISNYTFKYEEININGFKAYQTTDNPTAGNGYIETVIVVNEKHYVVFKSVDSVNPSDIDYKLYMEMLNSLKYIELN